jgi:putative glycosyltransferase (TIGR04372 family)
MKKQTNKVGKLNLHTISRLRAKAFPESNLPSHGLKLSWWSGFIFNTLETVKRVVIRSPKSPLHFLAYKNRKKFYKAIFYRYGKQITSISRYALEIMVLMGNSGWGNTVLNVISFRGMGSLLLRFTKAYYLLMIRVAVLAKDPEKTVYACRVLRLLVSDVELAVNVKLASRYSLALMNNRNYDYLLRGCRNVENSLSSELNFALAFSCLMAGDFQRADEFIKKALTLALIQNFDAWFFYRVQGRIQLALDNYEGAKELFEISCSLKPESVIAHQNYAGRYDLENYKPKQWEIDHAGELMIYDNLGQLAEDCFLAGNMKLSMKFYHDLLHYQESLSSNFTLPSKLQGQLGEYPGYDPLKSNWILPYEWVIQFGHIGLLDTYIKMVRLGMLADGNHLLLAPKNKVSNQAFLDLWSEYFVIIRDQSLVDELFPYQRYIGRSFMAYPGDGGNAEHWTSAGARASMEWTEKSLEPLLKLDKEELQNGDTRLQSLGVPKGGWYVGLHVREGGFYNEAQGGSNEHRNARIEDYLPAIKEVTGRGGWVVRLGDVSMLPLPEDIPGVIDYALSTEKSEEMDMFLLATCRFIIGTTTGLTTAAQCFGTPMVLVNCLSGDWQLWTGNIDFITKLIYDTRQRRHLSYREVYTESFQKLLIDNQLMQRKGFIAKANSPEDILQAVYYKLDVVMGPKSDQSEHIDTFNAYRRAINKTPNIFGAAKPVPGFIEKYSELLTNDDHYKASEPSDN